MRSWRDGEEGKGASHSLLSYSVNQNICTSHVATVTTLPAGINQQEQSLCCLPGDHLSSSIGTGILTEQTGRFGRARWKKSWKSQMEKVLHMEAQVPTSASLSVHAVDIFQDFLMTI